MTYEFETFVEDCRKAYETKDGAADLEIIRRNLENLLQNNEVFVEKYCGAAAEVGVHELYKDKEAGFIVYAHIQEKGRTSPPHDHGASWAVYGQAKKFTDMTEWRRLDNKSKDGYAKIETTRTYRLEPGMAGKFGPHEIHQISFEDGARFVRITGADLFIEDTLTYNPETNNVTVVGNIAPASGKPVIRAKSSDE
ncbi:MAG: hypothetical protein VX617_05395 [Pseudomonadota bacterium]|nr:hypothetical protein [Pseudomonadota bacterium]